MTTGPINRVIQQVRTVVCRPGAERTDAQLLETFVRRRDAAALEVLIRRHGDMVWGVCRRLLANHHDAEDAFQATFLVLLRRAAAIVPRSMIGNWLYGVARQTALTKLRTILVLVLVLTVAAIGIVHRLLPVHAAGAVPPEREHRAFGGNAIARAPDGGGEPKARDALEAFDLLTPAARLQWLKKRKRAEECTAVARGDVIATVVARGALESARAADVVCTVRAERGKNVSSVITWVIDDGTMVKKGDLVLELDDQALKAALVQAEERLDVTRLEAEKAKGDKVKHAAVAQAQKRVRDLQQQIQACRTRAPQDGMVIYWVPENRRDGKQQPIVAQGEPVRDGQKLLQVVDLSQLQVRVLVPEAQVGRVRPRQPAAIRVDAIPKRVFQGRVTTVDAAAQQSDFLFEGVKRYRVLIAIDKNDARLLPGMRAGARSARRRNYCRRLRGWRGVPAKCRSRSLEVEANCQARVGLPGTPQRATRRVVYIVGQL